jgi:hypothetical protein
MSAVDIVALMEEATARLIQARCFNYAYFFS